MPESVFDKRYAEAVAGLSKPAATNTGDKWAPFSSSAYKWKARIGDLSSPEWTALRARTPEELIPKNPYACESPVSAVWNAAIGIPSCGWRGLIGPTQRPAPVRMSNTGFQIHTAEAFVKSGPVQGGWRRPRSPYILDLVANRKGWDLFEAAHVMAHIQAALSAGDARPMLALVHGWLAKMAVALRYSLPVFDGDWTDPLRFPESGFRIVTSASPRNPTFRLPVSADGGLIPFYDLGAVFVAVGTETIPSGFKNATGRWTAATRWCCCPTQLVITGWEFADALTHMPVLTDRNAYSVCWQDLQDMDGFEEVLRAAPKAEGYSVDELLASDQYRKWKSATPPLPARGCLSFRTDESSGFVRPLGKRPEGELNPRIREHQAWLNWEAGTEQIRKMVERATVFYETGNRIRNREGRPIPRKQRTTAYNRLLKLIRIERTAGPKIRELRSSGWLKESAELEDKRRAAREEIEKIIGQTEKKKTDQSEGLEKEVPQSVVGIGEIQGREMPPDGNAEKAAGPSLDRQQRPIPEIPL